MLTVLFSVVLAVQSAAPLAIENVTVIEPGKDKPATAQTVVIENGVFTAVGKDVKVPPGARRVDGTGKFLIPGLWDMHVHWYDEAALGLFTANGVTGVRVMWGMAQHKEWRRKAGDGPRPRIVTAGPIVDGADPVWEGSTTFTAPDRAAMFVLNHRADEWDFIKVYSLLRRAPYLALMAEAKQQGVPVAGHVPFSVSLLEAAKAGHKCNEHLGGIIADLRPGAVELRAQVDLALGEEDGKNKAFALMRASGPYPTPGAVQDYGRRLAREGMWQCPTLVVLRNISMLDKPDFAKDPRLKYVSPEMRQMWDPANDFRFQARKPEDWEKARADYREKTALIAPLKRAGTKFLAGTDCLNPYCFPGFSLHDELALLVEAGLTPTEALEAATINPARYFGTSKTMGLVKKGFAADAVLLSRNPLQDIKNTTSITAVLQSGRLYDRTELDAILKSNER